MLLAALGLIALGLLSGSSCSANSTATDTAPRYIVAQAQSAQQKSTSDFERPTLDQIPIDEAEPRVNLNEKK